MATFRQNWVPQHETFFNTWVDISPSTTGTVGSDIIRGMSLVAGAVKFGEYIASQQDAACFLGTSASACNTLPPDADPPFPPVYPYLFGTDDIYGRDHLSLNLKMVRRDTYKFDATIILNGSPVDLTGGIVRMTAKWSVSDPDSSAVFQLSSVFPTQIQIISAVNGQIRVTIASALTDSLPYRKVELPYDIQFIDVAGNVFTVLYGTLTIVPDVTRTI